MCLSARTFVSERHPLARSVTFVSRMDRLCRARQRATHVPCFVIGERAGEILRMAYRLQVQGINP
jgi:hypothetical protein